MVTIGNTVQSITQSILAKLDICDNFCLKFDFVATFSDDENTLLLLLLSSLPSAIPGLEEED